MAFTITTTEASFSGQKKLPQVTNKSKISERSAPEVKSKDKGKGHNTTADSPTPDVKINFSSKGLEAALKQPASDVQFSAAAKEFDTKSEQPKTDAKAPLRAKEKEAPVPSPSLHRTTETREVEAPLISKTEPKTKASDVKATPALKTDPKTTSQTPAEVKSSPSTPSTKAEVTKALNSIASKTVAGRETPTSASKQDAASNSAPTNQADEAAKTAATSKSSAPAPLSAISSTTKQASSQAINFGQVLLNERGIVASAGKAPEQPVRVANNLVSTLAAPTKVLAAQPKATVAATDTGAISTEPSNEESEKKATETKKPSSFLQGGANAYEIAKSLLDRVRTNALEGGTLGTLRTIGANNSTSTDDSLKALERIIKDTESLRSNLTAFQTSTLQSNGDSLRAKLGNQVSTESTIRNSDYAAEIAAFTKSQLEPNRAVLGNANQLPQIVSYLLRTNAV